MANRNDLARQFRRRRKGGGVYVMSFPPLPVPPGLERKEPMTLRERLVRAFGRTFGRRPYGSYSW